MAPRPCTIKGYGMGDTAEGKTSLTVKKMNMDGVRYVRDRFQRVPVADADLENCRITFPEGSEEHTNTCMNARQAPHGYPP